jgi:hypothetical protein
MIGQTFDMVLKGVGWHRTYVDGEELVVDWYDFGDDVPYESGNKLLFDGNGCRQLRLALGLRQGKETEKLAQRVATRFDSYFEVRQFVDQRGIPYRHEVDFFP